MPLATILIEDSPTIKKGLIPALAELAGVEVIASAETADQGIAALNVHEVKWRLAVVDILLKVGNGLQVLRAARGRRGDQHVIVLTNYATQDIRQRSIECGADAVFDKSTEIDQFMELCRRYSAEQTAEAAHSPSAPRRLDDDEPIRDPRRMRGIDELMERVAIDRLLTDAGRESVEKKRGVCSWPSRATQPGATTTAGARSQGSKVCSGR